MVFGGGRVLASDPPAAMSSFPPLGGGDIPVVLPIPLATATAAAVAAEVAAEVASTMVIGLPDIACASQSETRVLDVAANVGVACQGGLPLLSAHTRDRGHNHQCVICAPD
jgi:hypothetical protein